MKTKILADFQTCLSVPLNRASYFLNEHFLKIIYFSLYSLIFELYKYCMGQHICHKTKKINLLQKRAVHFDFNEDKVTQDLSHKRSMH